ncbi:MAG: hypothetical protein PUP93_18040 [Rhizonema sp. NSF051]|nr:hypothetical protein [Rhizonema sp. NSF051]
MSRGVKNYDRELVNVNNQVNSSFGHGGNAVLTCNCKSTIDELLVGNEKLQQFLTWVKEKSDSVEAPYKPAAVRAFYLNLDQGRGLDFALDLNLGIDLDLIPVFYLDRGLARDLALAGALAHILHLLNKGSMGIVQITAP